MSAEFNEEMLSSYLSEAEAQMLRALPREKELHHRFSRRFRRSMRVLIREERRSPNMRYYMRQMRNAAAVFAIAIVMAFVLTMSVEAARVRLFSFFTQVFMELTSIRVDGNAGRSYLELESIHPFYVPNGYKKIDEVIDEMTHVIVYENEDNRHIIFSQDILTASEHIYDTEDADIKELYINDQLVTLSRKKNSNRCMLYWHDEKYSFWLSGADVPEIELIKMAKSVKKAVKNEELSKIYGIPVAIISELPAETRLQLSNGINQGNVIASDETYVKISYNENGEPLTQKANVQEHVASALTQHTDSNDWMKIHTTIVDKGSYAQVSATFTWLIRPAFRMKDVIALSVAQGTVIDDSAEGFYMYTTSQGCVYTPLTSGFDYQGHGIVRNVTLAKPNNPVKSDIFFIKANIYKEGSSERLNGTYGHQRLSIVLNPNFSVARTGVLSCRSFNLGMTYDCFTGCTLISW